TMFIMSADEERIELNPKYIEKLIETRLYAITEKKHPDGAIFTFYCPRCGHNSTVIKPLFFQNLTMDSFMHAVSGYRFETHACVCGNKLNYNNIITAQYSHFFHDTEMDLQAEITSGSEFVAFYAMNLKGERQQIDNCMDLRYMYRIFGHVLSARECWRHALATVKETKTIQLYNIEEGYTIVAIPGESSHSEASMREITGPDWPGSSAVVIRLKDLDEEPERFTETYQEWMPDYVDDISSGYIDAVAVMDISILRLVIQNTLKSQDIDFFMKDDVCRIEKKPFYANISLNELLKEAVYRGRSLQEIADEKIDFGLNRIYAAEGLYKNIHRDMPTYDFAVDDDGMEVTNPRNGLSERVDIYGIIPKNGDRIIVSHLREVLNKSESFQPTCGKCGKEALILKSIEPLSWLKHTHNAMNYVYEEKENAILLYYVSCGEHTEPVKRTDMAQWLVERNALDEVFEKELDSLRLNVEAHGGVFGKDVIVGVLSNNACDIMVHPAFIKGLLQQLRVDLGKRVIAYAPMKEMVLTYKEDADMENLNKAVMDLQSLIASKDLKQTALDYADIFDLSEAHGVFNLVTLPEKQNMQIEGNVFQEG
ncbi:MAG TPA: hypothetical protein VGK13_00765, partial [Methanocellaceae archaeon]